MCTSCNLFTGHRVLEEVLTHVAMLVRSIAIGRNVGIAKEASVVALRVLDCQGAGSVSNVVAGAATVACWTAAACCVVSPGQT